MYINIGIVEDWKNFKMDSVVLGKIYMQYLHAYRYIIYIHQSIQ